MPVRTSKVRSGMLTAACGMLLAFPGGAASASHDVVEWGRAPEQAVAVWTRTDGGEAALINPAGDLLPVRPAWRDSGVTLADAGGGFNPAAALLDAVPGFLREGFAASSQGTDNEEAGWLENIWGNTQGIDADEGIALTDDAATTTATTSRPDEDIDASEPASPVTTRSAGGMTGQQQLNLVPADHASNEEAVGATLKASITANRGVAATVASGSPARPAAMLPLATAASPPGQMAGAATDVTGLAAGQDAPTPAAAASAAMPERGARAASPDLAKGLPELNRMVVHQAGRIVAEGVASRIANREAAGYATAETAARLAALRRAMDSTAYGPDLSLREYLDGEGFNVRLGAAGGDGGSVPALWGRGGYSHLYDGSGTIAVEGEMFRGEVGIENVSRHGLVGLGYSHAAGSFDYINGHGVNGPQRGNYDIKFDTVFPYFNVALARGMLWGMFATGNGELTTTNPQTTAAARLHAVRVGMVMTLPNREHWRLHIEAGGQRASTRAGSSTVTALPLEDVVVNTSDAALGLEYTTAVGEQARFTGYLGARQDSGKHESGKGFEAGLHLAGPPERPGGLTYAFGVRQVQLVGGNVEWSVDGEVKRTQRLEGLGLDWGIGLRSGAATGQRGLERSLTRVGEGPLGTRSAGWAFTPHVGYGIQVGDGLVNVRLGSDATDAGSRSGYGISYETGDAWRRWGMGWRHYSDGEHEWWSRMRQVLME